MTTAKENEFQFKVIDEANKHLKDLLETYGYGWELYIKCDTNGNIRFCPKGEIYLKQDEK